MRRHVAYILCGLVVSCTEYDLGEHDGINDGGLDAQGEVSPESVVGAICGGEAETTLTLSSVGTAPLILEDVQVTAGDWTVDPVVLPATVAPDTSLTLVLRGTGDGELVLTTNDLDEPRFTVPLRVVVGSAPEVVLVSPSVNDVLEVASPTLLEARVTDADGDPSDREVSWSSSVDGALGASAVDASGASVFEWPSTGRTAGGHVITATVPSACGDGTASVEVCQQGGYLEEELDLEGWNFEGSASWDSINGWLEVTRNAQYQVGSAFETRQTVRGNDVVVRFRMYIGDGSGADGMSVTVLDSDRMTSFLGGDGCGLGFGGGSCNTTGSGLPGYSVEFDTYYNSAVDPTEEDHIAFYVDGDLNNPVAWVEAPGLEGTGWHDVEVRVQEPAVEVSVDGQVMLSAFLTGEVDFDFPAHVGFTAGTGYFTNLHLVDALEVEQLVCP